MTCKNCGGEGWLEEDDEIIACLVCKVFFFDEDAEIFVNRARGLQCG